MGGGQQRLGSLLVEMGFIDDEQLESALDEQNASGKRLGRILVDAAIITEERLVHALSRQLGIDTCDPVTTNIHERVLKLLPIELAYRHRCLPLALKKEESGEVIFVATSDPLNKTALSDIRSSTNNRRVRWLLAGETAMELALARHYGSPPKRSVRPTPLPEGTPVITGRPVSAPKSSGRPQPRTSDLFMLSNDLGSVKQTTGSIALEGLGFDSADLPPIEVPPELLSSPDAAIQIIEAEMPRPSNGAPDPSSTSAVEDFEVLDARPIDEPIESVEPFELPPLNGRNERNQHTERIDRSEHKARKEQERRDLLELKELKDKKENGHRALALPPMPAPSQPFVMSWGDLVAGGGPEALVPAMPSVFPWQPDPTPSIEIEDAFESELPHPHETHEESETSDDVIAELAAKALAVAEALDAQAQTDPGTIVESEMAMDSTEVGAPPPRFESDSEDLESDGLPDASFDAISTSDVDSSPNEEATEMEVTRAAVMREVLLRFIEVGALEVGPQAVLRLLAAIMEQEGLLTEEKIARAMSGK